MKVFVKNLRVRGEECEVEVEDTHSVIAFKQQVERRLNMPIDQQRLVFSGKTLQDDKYIRDYPLKDGCRVFLTVKREAAGATSGGSEKDLWTEVESLLKQHYSPEDSALVLEKFRKNFHQTIDSLSLDDIERLAKANLQKSST